MPGLEAVKPWGDCGLRAAAEAPAGPESRRTARSPLRPTPPTAMTNATNDDTALLDVIREGFDLESDAAVAALLGITPTTIHRVRHGKARLGPIQRLKVLDRVGFIRARSLVEMIAPDRLAQAIRTFSHGQAKRLAQRKLERQRPRTADAELLDLAKEVFEFRTDEDLAAFLGLARHRMSMVRTGRSALGPKPRLKLLRLVEDFDLDAVLATLESSEDLAARIRAYAGPHEG